MRFMKTKNVNKRSKIACADNIAQWKNESVKEKCLHYPDEFAIKALSLYRFVNRRLELVLYQKPDYAAY